MYSKKLPEIIAKYNINSSVFHRALQDLGWKRLGAYLLNPEPASEKTSKEEPEKKIVNPPVPEPVKDPTPPKQKVTTAAKEVTPKPVNKTEKKKSFKEKIQRSI